MASEYKKRGGSYNTDKKDQDDSQKHLSKWSEEEWQTKEGSGNAKQADGTEKRYLPKKAWEEMTEEEKKETDEKKLAESKQGKQFVQNTERAKSARSKANKEESEKYEAKKGKDKIANGRDNGNKGDRKTKQIEEDDEDDEQEYHEDGDEDEDDEGAGEQEVDNDEDEDEEKPEPEKKAPKKRGRPAKSDGANKKQKNFTESSKQTGTIGSKRDSSDAPAPQASASRLPKKGQTIHWKSLPGWVSGECLEVVSSEKEVGGKKVKGKKDDPRIVMRSKNGKIAVHKPEAVYFE